MLFREHRGSLKSSMATVREIGDTLADVAAAVGASVERVTVEKYGGFDARIGWDTHIVCVDGQTVGFTNGGCRENSNEQ